MSLSVTRLDFNMNEQIHACEEKWNMEAINNAVGRAYIQKTGTLLSIYTRRVLITCL